MLNLGLKNGVTKFYPGQIQPNVFFWGEIQPNVVSCFYWLFQWNFKITRNLNLNITLGPGIEIYCRFSRTICFLFESGWKQTNSGFRRDRFLGQELSMFQLSWWLWSPAAHKVSTGLSCSHLPWESAMCYWAEMAAEAQPETIGARWMFFTIIFF